MTTSRNPGFGRIAKVALGALALAVLLVPLLGATIGPNRMAAAQATPGAERPAAGAERPHRPAFGDRRAGRLTARCVRRATLAAARGRLDAALADLVADGTLTQDQANAVKTEVAGGTTAAAATPGLALDDAGSGRPGPCARLLGAARLVDAVAGIVGLPGADVLWRLVAGESLTEIAEAEGVSRDDLIAELEAVYTERLDAAVASGRITEAERAERAAALPDRLAALVDHRRGDGRTEVVGR